MRNALLLLVTLTVCHAVAAVALANTAEIPLAEALAMADRQSVVVLDEAEVPQVGAVVATMWAGGPLLPGVPAILRGGDLAVHVTLRHRGQRLAAAWGGGETGLIALQHALVLARQRLDAAAAAPDLAEVTLAHGFEPVPFQNRGLWFSDRDRGIYGIELRLGERVERYGPLQAVSEKRSFEAIIDRFEAPPPLPDKALASEVVLRRFAAEQILVRLPDGVGQRLFRGNRVVPLAAVTRAETEATLRRLSVWLAGNVRRDGRLAYRYAPSRGREAEGNDAANQWLASAQLGRLARETRNPVLGRIVERNVRHNLDAFYHVKQGRGLIEYRGSVQLAGMAGALLAIAEMPDRNAFAAEEQALRRSILELWNDDGSFSEPGVGTDEAAADHHGETLYLLARLYRQTDDPVLLQRLMTSYGYYARWLVANRDPGFVPRHTQAYYLVWGKTQYEFLKEWLFLINDWLLGLQPSAPSAHPDLDGRFHDPLNPQFGKPDAAATGLYLQGLVDAFRLARQVGDRDRSEAYRRAILRGLRSIMQLQFVDESDLFYVAGDEVTRVRGALRTTVYDNEIRLASVHAALAALRRVLEVFGEHDFRSAP